MIQFIARGANLVLLAQERAHIVKLALISEGRALISFCKHTHV